MLSPNQLRRIYFRMRPLTFLPKHMCLSLDPALREDRFLLEIQVVPLFGTRGNFSRQFPKVSTYIYWSGVITVARRPTSRRKRPRRDHGLYGCSST
jgi:hypothetical protein